MLNLIPVERSPLILTSTEMRRIAAGEWADLYDEKVDGKRVDLTYAWKPRLGMLTEDLHGWWHEHITGDKIAKAPAEPNGRGIPCRVAGAIAPDYAASSYDFIVNGMTLLECKHTNERQSLPGIATYYGAQFQWQMLVAGVGQMRLSIIRGNSEPEWGLLDADPVAQAKLMQLGKDFLWHVTEKQRPDDTPADDELKATLAVPVINGLKPYDMSRSNEWVAKAGEFIEQKKVADTFKVTEKEIRAMIPKDASVVTGGGLSFKRDARGAYRVSIDD